VNSGVHFHQSMYNEQQSTSREVSDNTSKTTNDPTVSDSQFDVSLGKRSCGIQTEDNPSAETFSVLLKEVEKSNDAKTRCGLLKRLNEKLETERVTLQQVKLQLQLRVEEFDSALSQ